MQLLIVRHHQKNLFHAVDRMARMHLYNVWAAQDVGALMVKESQFQTQRPPVGNQFVQRSQKQISDDHRFTIDSRFHHKIDEFVVQMIFIISTII